MTNQNKAFTLIELLVVIAIIGVLSTLIMANFVGVRERARDAQRKSDISQIQKALEIYKQSQTTAAYPATGFSALKTALEAGNYMKTVPHDPNWVNNNSWEYIFVKPDPNNPTDILTYKIVACLENASDQQKDLTKDALCSLAGQNASITRYNP